MEDPTAIPNDILREVSTENLERDVQKQLLTFCKILLSFVETWKIALKEAKTASKALSNFSEQLRCVEKADIHYMENFGDVQEQLIGCHIIECIEEELEATKIQIEKLKKANLDLINKLSTLEQATTDLDWDIDSPLLKGTPIQPPLKKLLQMAYEFWIYFSNASKNINEKRKALNCLDEKSVKEFEQSFCLDLDNPGRDTQHKIYLLLALTQYVVNEKAVI